ncbi:MAG TPA: high-affinity nickel-transport family protein [Acidimicrobiia bacterium]|nr:high-affinity nickel-transport family protein [Acidimicrobiia bacterium]
MLNLALAFATSLLLGMRHATDPDHIVAVSTIVSRERSMSRAGGVGLLWGMGHTATILIVGGAIILLKLAFTPTIGLSLEMAVAAMLIVLGALNVLNVRPSRVVSDSVRPFVVGVVHGLAGSAAATLVILPLIEDVRWALLYLVVFGLGTIAGMGLVTLAIAAPAAFAAPRVHSLERSIRLATGAMSLVFGIYLSWRIGYVDGLFTAHPRWTPQ